MPTGVSNGVVSSSAAVCICFPYAIVTKDGYVYCKIVRGMYGLKQAAKLARERLVTHLKQFGDFPTTQVHNIWAHTTLNFCVCV